MNGNLLAALGLMLIIEGLLPFLSPARWRQTLLKLTALNDGQLRFVGLVLMSFGLLLFGLVG